MTANPVLKAVIAGFAVRHRRLDPLRSLTAYSTATVTLDESRSVLTTLNNEIDDFPRDEFAAPFTQRPARARASVLDMVTTFITHATADDLNGLYAKLNQLLVDAGLTPLTGLGDFNVRQITAEIASR